jgi:hypothetical protein
VAGCGGGGGGHCPRACPRSPKHTRTSLASSPERVRKGSPTGTLYAVRFALNGIIRRL